MTDAERQFEIEASTMSRDQLYELAKRQAVEIERLKLAVSEIAASGLALSRHLDDRVEEVYQLRRELAEARAYIIRNHNSDYKDYACAQCDPDGEIVVPGFTCQYHRAAKKD